MTIEKLAIANSLAKSLVRQQDEVAICKARILIASTLEAKESYNQMLANATAELENIQSAFSAL